MGSEFESSFNSEFNPITRKIVRLLSNNSRITISEMAKELGISRSTAAGRLKKIEQALHITYTLELNPVKLGLANPHMILVKFKKRPDYADVGKRLLSYYITQFAARIHGTYDLLICANAYSLPEYLTWDMKMRAQMMHRYEGMQWQTSDVSFNRLGYVPIRGEAINHAKIPKRHKKMLGILNSNSRISLNRLSKEMRMNYKSTVYNFNSLVGQGYIKRFTICLDPGKNVSLITMFETFIPTLDYAGVEKVSDAYFKPDDRNPLISRNLLVSHLVGNYDYFSLGAYDNFKAGYENGVKRYQRMFKDFELKKVEYGEVSEVLIGLLPVRSVDTAKEFRHFHI